MRNILLSIVLLIMMIMVSACANSTESQVDACQIKLSKMSFLGLEFTETQVEDVQDEPFPGSLLGEAMTFGEGTMLLSRYESSEKAAELLNDKNALSLFGADATILLDPPAVAGDQTVWVQHSSEGGVLVDAAIVRYGDYLMLADPNADAFAVEGMLDAFDGVLLDYIDEHPECAYLHTDAR